MTFDRVLIYGPSNVRKWRFSAICLFAGVLTACGQPQPVAITPPPALLTCADEPAPPSLPERDGTDATQQQRDVLMLDGYLAMRSAWGDCRAKVDGVRAWVEGVR